MSITVDVQQAPASPPGDGLRFVPVRANLVPTEVLATRAHHRTRRHVLVALAALVAALGLAFGVSWWQTHAAHNDLAAERRQAATLQAQTNSFAPLVTAQDVAGAVRTQLQRLLVGDLPWQRLLATLQAQAPAGVALTQVTGTVSSSPAAPTSSTGTSAGLPVTGQQVGSLTITGTARDKDAIADFVDALSGTSGLSTPLINSVSAADNTVTFNVTVPITSAALGGRWTPVAAGRNGDR